MLNSLKKSCSEDVYQKDFYHKRLEEIFRHAALKGASDVHFRSDGSIFFRIDGKLQGAGTLTSTGEVKTDNQAFFKALIPEEKYAYELRRTGQSDFSATFSGVRCRVNLYLADLKLNAAVRIIPGEIPDADSLLIPPVLQQAVRKKSGLILLTGATGSGKSTTLAALIESINKERYLHIITLEDPVEYIYSKGRSLIHQREIGRDTASFHTGLRAFLRQDPDIFMLGELRDEETVITALKAAETGHLVLATLHTGGAVSTVNRIISMFQGERQAQVREQLADNLLLVATQKLLPRKGGKGRVAAFEIMVALPAVRNLIRKNNCSQIQSYLATGVRAGMRSMDYALRLLRRRGLIK